MADPGDRVGAILSGSRDGTISFIGYGVYEGDFPLSEGVTGWLADFARQAKIKTPRIRLDSGDVVWGCECWWGPEEYVRKACEQASSVVPVDIDAVREGSERDHGRDEEPG